MAKKIISIVLSVIFAFSAFAICSFAGDTITAEDRELYPEEELAIADPKDRIDRTLLSGKKFGYIIQDTAASKDVIEDNLYYWKDEIINEYHALEAKGDAATDAEWGALYRKMKTPHNWSRIRSENNVKYLTNSYRVLLTRARQGFIIYIPEGVTDDATRLPAFYDETFNYLKAVGIQEI